jgi:predicted dehydrogenase
VNTTHAGAFAKLLNTGEGIGDARLDWVWGGTLRPNLPDAPALAAQYGIAKVAGAPTEFIEQTDLVLIVDDTGGGASHAEFARPFLAAGVPTFIDKPMSLDVAEARDLFALAGSRGAPLTSSSPLRFSVELEAARDRIAALGPISSVVSTVPGEWFYYGIHGVEQLFAAVGGGVEWVSRTAWPVRDVSVMSFVDGRAAVVQTLRDASHRYILTFYGRDGWLSVETSDSAAFYRRELEAAVAMAASGVPPVPATETLELLAVLRAGEISAERGGARVAVAEALS